MYFEAPYVWSEQPDMPGAGAYRSLVSRLSEITRRAVREPWTRMRVALKLSIDPGHLVRQLLLGVFLTDWAEAKINGHAAVVFVDDASTVTIDSDTGCTCACHDVPLRLKAEIVGIVMHERKRKGVRRVISRRANSGLRRSPHLCHC